MRLWPQQLRHERPYDRIGARNFAAAARAAGVRRLIYLGGLGGGDDRSSHLDSRHEVGRILRDSGVPTIELRAAIILGSGSASFEMIRALVETLPVMPTDEDQAEADLERMALVSSIYIPLQKEKDEDQKRPPQQITIVLRSTGDKDRDRRRIKTTYGTLISFNGKDRFSFQIFENGTGHLIDFPNDTTRICPEMLLRLKKLMGEENWRVEEITFQ